MMGGGGKSKRKTLVATGFFVGVQPARGRDSLRGCVIDLGLQKTVFSAPPEGVFGPVWVLFHSLSELALSAVKGMTSIR